MICSAIHTCTCTTINFSNIVLSPLASLGGVLDGFINLIDGRILHTLSIDGYDGISRVEAGHERHAAGQNTLNKRLKNFALLSNTTIALKGTTDEATVI